MNACQSPRTVYPASNLPVQKRGGLTTISWIGCLARSSCACRSVWRAAAMLPQQPCSRSGACHTVHPAGHGDARTYFIIKLYCRARITISGAITRWIGCLARSSSACGVVWRAAAMLPRQPYTRSGACNVVDPAGHAEAGCARHEHGIERQ